MYEPEHIISLASNTPEKTSKAKTVILSLFISMTALAVLAAGYVINTGNLNISTRANLEPIDINVLPASNSIAQNESLTLNMFINPQENDIGNISTGLVYDPEFLKVVHYDVPDYLEGSVKVENTTPGLIKLHGQCDICPLIPESSNLVSVIFQPVGKKGKSEVRVNSLESNTLISTAGKKLNSIATKASVEIR